jgi:antitoxin VapB
MLYMPLSIKNADLERLARQVATETGESLTEAIRKALEERWHRLRLRHKHRSRILRDQLEDVLRRVDAMPRLDNRPADEILDYDEHGVPR